MLFGLIKDVIIFGVFFSGVNVVLFGVVGEYLIKIGGLLISIIGDCILFVSNGSSIELSVVGIIVNGVRIDFN